MINPEQYPQALRVLHRLIVQAKADAYDSGQTKLAELLNDLEMLPEYLGDEQDRSIEFYELLEGIAATHPSCRYIVDEFARIDNTGLIG
jgi:hypothetical protein